MATTDKLKVTNLFSVHDHVCLVTGGGTGIGLMAAQALASNGAKVYITGRRKEVLDNAAKTHEPAEPGPAAKGTIIPIGPYDVTSKEQLEELYAELSSKEKYVSLVVAAAGVPGPKDVPEPSDAKKLKATLWNESPSEWADTYNTDVSAVFFTVVSMLPLLQATPSHISASAIVISSMSGLMRHAQGHFSYNAAKAATAHLSRLMSREFEKASIRVNSIAPGYFPSEMTMKESDERNKTHMPEEKVKDKGHEVPAGRSGRDEEMAMAVMFLTCCDYVNGEVIKVDGGVLNEVGS